jgi:hypothetical protein
MSCPSRLAPSVIGRHSKSQVYELIGIQRSASELTEVSATPDRPSITVCSAVAPISGFQIAEHVHPFCQHMCAQSHAFTCQPHTAHTACMCFNIQHCSQEQTSHSRGPSRVWQRASTALTAVMLSPIAPRRCASRPSLCPQAVM